MGLEVGWAHGEDSGLYSKITGQYLHQESGSNLCFEDTQRTQTACGQECGGQGLVVRTLTHSLDFMENWLQSDQDVANPLGHLFIHSTRLY